MVKAALYRPYIMRSMAKRVFFSTSATKSEGGVSMVQGASRGIGLEFVSSFLLFFFSFSLSCSCHFLYFLVGLLEELASCFTSLVNS